MRFNYRHFNHALLPTFTDGDALLAERVENLIALTREMLACDDGDKTVLEGLRSVLERDQRDLAHTFAGLSVSTPAPGSPSAPSVRSSKKGTTTRRARGRPRKGEAIDQAPVRDPAACA